MAENRKPSIEERTGVFTILKFPCSTFKFNGTLPDGFHSDQNVLVSRDGSLIAIKEHNFKELTLSELTEILGDQDV